MELFELMAKLSLDDEGFSKGVEQADKSGKTLAGKMEKAFGKIGKIAKTVFAGYVAKTAVNAIKNLVMETANFGDTVDKQSQVLGMSRKAYQEWEYILSQNGASIDSMSISMKTMNAAIASDSDDVKSAFSELGVSMDMIKSMSVEDQFDYLVHQFQKLPAGANKSALAIKLFGRNGMDLLPLLNSTSDSLYELRDQAKEYGLVMDDEAVDASVKFGDTLDTMKRTFKAFGMSFGSRVLPVITNAMQKITDYTGKLRKAYEKNGLKGVFDTLVADIRGIQWPTWDQVKDAAIAAWDTIKNGALTLGGLIFGRKEDGSVDWPTWDTLLNAATEAWGKIKDGAKTLGGLVFGKKEDGSVNWPTWDTLLQAANQAWSDIKTAALGIADKFGGIVFGRAEDGSVNWPTWDTLLNAANTAWKAIKDGALTVGGLVFGKAEDGSVNWPTWDTLLNAANTAWEAIKDGALTVGGLVFGKAEDGSVNWPTWDTLLNAANTAWGKIKEGALTVGGLIFGKSEDGDVNWPTWDTLLNSATQAWGKIKEGALTLAGLVFGKKEDGSVDWPTWDTVQGKANEIWGEIINGVAGFAGLIFGRNNDGTVNYPTWDSIGLAISKAWDKIKEEAAKLTGFKMGDMDNSASLLERILNAWNNIKEAVEGVSLDLFTALFGEQIGEDVAGAIEHVLNALVAFGTGFMAFKAVNAIKNITESLKTLFSFKGLSTNKAAIILAGLVTLATLVIEHWDEIKAKADEVIGWLQTNVFEPVQAFFEKYITGPIGDAINWIHDLLVDLGVVKEELSEGGVYKLEGSALEQMQMLLGTGKYNNQNTVGKRMREIMEPLGYTTEQIENMLTALQQSDYDYEFVEALIREMTKAEKGADVLKNAVNNLPSEKQVKIKLNIEGAEGLEQLETLLEGSGGTGEHSGSGGSFAKGSWNVPHDMFAQLHRGEMVLTASQAREFRNGASGGYDLAGVIAESVKAAVGNLAIVLNDKAVGRTIGDSVSGRVGTNLSNQGKRVSFGYGG